MGMRGPVPSPRFAFDCNTLCNGQHVMLSHATDKEVGSSTTTVLIFSIILGLFLCETIPFFTKSVKNNIYIFQIIIIIFIFSIYIPRAIHLLYIMDL